jgi:predicted dehydrogenase
VSEKRTRVAVVGVGEFGRNHARVWSKMDGAELVGVVDLNEERAKAVAQEFGTKVLRDAESLSPQVVDAVSVAVPTKDHSRIGCRLLDSGLDVLVEKPMAVSLGEADGLIASAQRGNRILQIGHLERFNPAVVAAKRIVSKPRFFEIHRLGMFTPRSLDIDVVFDVMIHDLDILTSFVDSPIVDLKAVGIPVVTDKVDIAQARIEFETGTVANLTASRVSTEKVRKLRFFQEHEYVSLDYARQDLVRVKVAPGTTEIKFEQVPVTQEEPLVGQLRAFLLATRTRRTPRVDGFAGRRALELAGRVMSGIQEHAERVKRGAFGSPTPTSTKP